MNKLRTIGGIIVAIGATAIAVLLVYRGAPVTAWATALGIGLVAATIVEPSQVLVLLGRTPAPPPAPPKEPEP